MQGTPGDAAQMQRTGKRLVGRVLRDDHPGLQNINDVGLSQTPLEHAPHGMSGEDDPIEVHRAPGQTRPLAFLSTLPPFE